MPSGREETERTGNLWIQKIQIGKYFLLWISLAQKIIVIEFFLDEKRKLGARKSFLGVENVKWVKE